MNLGINLGSTIQFFLLPWGKKWKSRGWCWNFTIIHVFLFTYRIRTCMLFYMFHINLFLYFYGSIFFFQLIFSSSKYMKKKSIYFLWVPFVSYYYYYSIFSPESNIVVDNRHNIIWKTLKPYRITYMTGWYVRRVGPYMFLLVIFLCMRCKVLTVELAPQSWKLMLLLYGYTWETGARGEKNWFSIVPK